MAAEATRESAQTLNLTMRKKRRRFRPIILWLVPILGLLFVFSVLPIFVSFYLSFFDYEILQPLEFVGVANYVYAFNQDPAFLKTMGNTFYYSLVSVPLGMAIALLIAQFIHSRAYFKSFFRTAYFMSYIMPAAAIALVWSFIFQASQFGLLNGVLGFFGIPAQPWLNSARLVIPAIILIGIWRNMGYNLVLFLAGLSNIPLELYEAAKIDGANSWQVFWKITWPLLSPTVMFLTVTGSIGALQVFDIPYIMTKGAGGPENASRMVVMWVQKVGFQEFRMGYASSLAFIFFAIVLVLTVIQLRYLRTKWNY
jgi:multiple sugar transport system permease protein